MKLAPPPAFIDCLIKSLLLILLLTACSSNPKQDPQRSEQVYFSTAMKAIESRNYLLAIEQLEALESRFPFGRYATQAQLELIYAYYKSLDYDSASVTAKRFIRLNPGHPQLDYAHYMLALAAYDVDRGFLARFLPTSPAERDLSPLKESYWLFKRFSQEFPDSQYYDDAQQRMLYITNLLADHEIEVGKYYFKRGAYLAAAKRAQHVLKHFPNTPATQAALQLNIMSYRALNMDDLAQTAQQVLMLNFPNSKPYLEDTLNAKKTRHTNWLNLLTFGLLGRHPSQEHFD